VKIVKRKISLVLLFMVMLVSFSPSITHASTRMIASDGFVTSHKTGTKTCDVINEDAAKGLYTSSVGSH
jgi:hypothetical protein